MSESTVTQPDVEISDNGSIVIVTPVTGAAKNWVTENVQLEDWQLWSGGFACEPRCLDNLVAGMVAAGLVVV